MFNILRMIRLMLRNRLRGGTTFLSQNPRFHDCEIGEWTYGEPSVFLGRTHGKLRIGKYCSIGPDVEMILVGDHRTDFVTTYPFSVFFKEASHITGYPRDRGDIVIGNDVWICYGARILAGARIGDGAVVGMGAVVTGAVPPYAIVAGNPARIIRYRFEQGVIEELLRIRWWTWQHEKVLRAAPMLASDDLGSFLRFAHDSAENSIQKMV
jgi:acetyltransferase-like isoleucine patch superfamily enzyme